MKPVRIRLPAPEFMIINKLKQEIKSKEKFTLGKTVVMGKFAFGGRVVDTALVGSSILDYDSYIKNISLLRSIQVLDVDNNRSLMKPFSALTRAKGFLDACIFYNPTKSFSLPKHRDTYHVLLNVVSGSKKVYIGNKIYFLNKGDWIFIPSGVYHKVLSTKNTYALSFAFDVKKFQKRKISVCSSAW